MNRRRVVLAVVALVTVLWLALRSSGPKSAARSLGSSPAVPVAAAPGRLSTAKFMSRIEDGDQELLKEGSRWKATGVVRFEPHRAPKVGASCPLSQVQKVIGISETRSHTDHGCTSIIAAASSGFAGVEHFDLYAAIIGTAKSKCVALDVGANEGVITTWLASCGCRVFSYEALRTNYRRIYSSLQSHPELGKRVTLVNAAVGNSCGQSVFISENDGGNESPAAQKNGQINSGQLPDSQVVYTRRVDDDVDEDILLYKIDTEGWEPAGLAGSFRLLQTRHVAFVHAEFSPSNIGSDVGPSGWLYMMAALNFEIYLADCQQASPAVFANMVVQCGHPEGAALALAVVKSDKGAPAKRVRVEDFESFTRVLKQAAGLVNLLLYNRVAHKAFLS